MQRWTGLLIGASLILGGCGCGGCRKNSNQSTAVLQVPAINHPIVAVVPVIDRSHSSLNWNLSNELSQAVRHRLTQKKQLYLVGEESFAAHAQKSIASNDPFGVETAWVKKAFPQNEFVVFMELLSHHEIANLNEAEPQDTPAQLTMSMRVRVFDVRGTSPQIVLQEVIEQSHHVPRQFTQANLNQVPWGDEAFDVSPLGIAHDMLCKELAGRIEDYIHVAGAAQ